MSVKNLWNSPISNPEPDLHNINANIKFGENPLKFTCYDPETKIGICCEQITLSEIDEICP